MTLSEAGTYVHAMSTGLTELLLWLLVQKQAPNTKVSQFAKRHGIGNICGNLKTFPLNPEAPVHQLVREEGQKRHGWYFSRITSAEAVAQPAAAASHPVWARFPNAL